VVGMICTQDTNSMTTQKEASMIDGQKSRRVLVTGGGTYLGMSIAIALLAEGADVTLLVREGNEKRLGILAQRVRWHHADIWDSASLRGRARGHGVVIHTVGSMLTDPQHGLTYQRLNVVSARHATNLCINDGVPYLVLLSSARAPWVSRDYIRSKREAEQYLKRTGIKHRIVRAPLVYQRGQARPLFYRMVSVLGQIPPISWLGLGNSAPMPLDVLARGVARTALQVPDSTQGKTLFARDLRRLNSRVELRGRIPEKTTPNDADDDTQPTPDHQQLFALMDEDTPFGWSPTQKTKRNE
jgi:uncharacterized protein YbjT (DUF2867 family)